jgi:hypothetical protein
MTVPVAITTPIPPVPMEVTVVYPMISWRHTENIIRWYNDDGPWDKRLPDSYPRSAVKGSPEPITFIEAIPVASIEIKTCHVRHQIDIVWSTRNYYYIRRSRKFQGWRRRRRRRRRNANVDVYLRDRTYKRDAHNKKQRKHK